MTVGENIAVNSAGIGKFTAKPHSAAMAVMARRKRAREKVREITFWILDLGFGIWDCGARVELFGE